MKSKKLWTVLFACLVAGCVTAPKPALMDPSLATATAPDEYTVKLVTSEGVVLADVVRAWAPRGADRFYNLVRANFFTDVAFFRVIAGFMAQTGVHGDPVINKACLDFDIDMASDLIPVHPACHYMVGGIETDDLGRTSLEGLYACGEVASTGFHGANRMGSNSLLEGAVMGDRAGRHAADVARPVLRGSDADPAPTPSVAGPLDLHDMEANNAWKMKEKHSHVTKVPVKVIFRRLWYFQNDNFIFMY